MSRRVRNFTLAALCGAAGLIDTRLALALLTILVLNELDYLRASIRSAHTETELWLRVMAEQLHVDLSDERAKEILAGLKADLPPDLWADLMRDWALIHRR